MKQYEMTVLKANMLGGMHEYIRHLNDEDAYDRWILIVPDEPTENDLISIAEDEGLWKDTCSLFGRLVKQYGGDEYIED